MGSVNNEPVAWAIKSDGDFTEIGWDDEVLYEVEEWYTAQGWQYEHIPLYTHPVKELKNIVLASATCSCGKVMEVTNLQAVKELTDEEIIEVCVSHWINPELWDDDDIDFARAILRKAQGD